MRDGIVLEMGGLDGKISSQSRVFEKVGWKRIVLEGNPQFRDALSQLSSAVTVAATVCEERQPTSSTRRPHVHFVTFNVAFARILHLLLVMLCCCTTLRTL